MRFAFAIVFIIALMISNTQIGIAADAAAGKATFAKKCGSCHGPNGEGNDKIAALMKVEMRHLGSTEVQAKSDADLKKIIIEGTGKMKPVKDVDAKAADDVVAHMRTLKK